MDIVGLFFSSPLTILLIGITIPILLWYSRRNHNFWKKQGIPYVKPYPFIGSFPGILTNSFEETEINRYKTLGDLYGLYEGNNPVLTVGKPELIKDIMIKDFQSFHSRRHFDTGDEVVDKMLTAVRGEDWKRIRTIVSPTFTTGKIRKVVTIFQDCSNTLIKNFRKSSDKGEPVNILKVYGAFTMDVIASSAFSTKLDSHNDPENEFVKRARAAFDPGLGIGFVLFLIMPKLLKKLGLLEKLFNTEHMDFFKRITFEIMEERNKTGQKRNDFLQLLIDATNEVSKDESLEESADDIIANYGDDSMNHPIFNSVKYKHLSMNELVAQCVIFFLAGYHTTAMTLAFATYHLAINQDIQERAYKELKEVLEETDGKFEYESIRKLNFLDNIISETLRMYPPLTRLERTANADYMLGETGLTIPKGMLIGIPIYAMHRDSKYFPDPEKFDPDRFTAERKVNQTPYTYLPFGIGPRNCVGMRFALMEIKVCLAYVLSTFKIQKCSETSVPIQLDRGGGLLKPKPIMLKMIPRNNYILKC